MGAAPALEQTKPAVFAEMRKPMLAGTRKLFVAPVFEDDEDKTRVAGLLNVVLLAFVAIAVVFFVFSLFAFHNLIALVILAVVILARLGALSLMRRGRVRLTSTLLVSVLWIAVTCLGVAAGGARSTHLTTYISIVLVAGLLLGGRAAIALAGLSIAAGLGMLYAEANGFLDQPQAPPTPFSMWVVLSANFIVAAALLHFATRSTRTLLERARRDERALAERARELEASQRVTFSVSERVSPDELLGLVVDLIRDQFDLYHVQVYIVDEEQRAAVLRESTGYAGYQLLQRKHRIPLDHPALVTQAINEGEPVLVADVSQAPNFMPNPLLPDTRSELVVPLKIGERIIGVLDAQARTPGRFTESTVALFQMTAEQIAFLFENSELLEGISRRTDALTTLATQLRTAADIAVQVSTVLDPERLLQQAVALMQARFGLYHAHVYLLDEETNRLTVRAGSGEVGRTLRERGHGVSQDAEKNLVARAARTRQIVLVNDTSLESDFTPTPLLSQTRSEMSAPLVAGNRVLGVLDLQDDQPGRFTQADLDTFSILAGQIATALQNARLFEEQQQARAALRESEDRYRDLMEHSHDLISTHDLKGQILSVNQEAARVLGYDQSELSKMNIRDLLAPEVRSEFGAYLAAMQERGVASGLMRVQASTGEKRIWEYNNILRTEGLAEPIVRAMAHDVTEVRRAEQALRKSEAKYRTLFANIADPIIIFDQETKLLLDCNQAMIDRYGYSLDELRTMAPYQLHPPEDLAAVDRNVDDKEDLSAHRYTHITKAGERIPVETHTAEIEYEGRDAWVSIIRDVTERERAEEARERFTNQLRTAADLTEQVNAILDPDELLREVATQLRDRFDLYHVHVYLLDEETRNLVMRAGSGEIGEVLREQGHEVSLDHERSLVARAARDRAPVLINDTGLSAGFAPSPLLPETRSEVAVPLVAGDKVLGVLDVQDSHTNRFTQSDLNVFSTLAGQIAIALQNASLFEEVRRTTEQLREADYLKGDLLSRLNHELRTPLNSIIGYTEIILMGIDGELDSRNLDYMQAIYENGQQLARVINNALELVRIEDHLLELKLEEVEISSLIDEVGGKAAALLANRPIEWAVEVEENLPPVQGDRACLNQILNNIVANAARFTSEGHIKLCAFSDNGWVCIKVEDTGMGIDEADLASMFARLRRSDPSGMRRAGVTGLDLVVTCHLVQMHGGEIDVRNQCDRGSTYTIRLPVQRRVTEAIVADGN